ncbi:MAG: hypothetical protein CVV61_00710 [Tenericutes bacterium HGW-Tenericutes-6]|jgi:hypothetical protein|nr:MAG: hypothetical protein CVV61_00710 [Tenericutes bacterium HGW-Tenericutes-6]
MKKWMLISWFILVLYTVYYLVFNQPRTTIFNDFLDLSIDPLIFAVFNMLGIIPFLMLLYVIIYQIKTNRIQKIGLSLSFVSGAFALYPTAAFLGENNAKKHQKWTIYATILSGISILFLAIYGFFFGSLNIYIESFKNDAFVHIMTIDFFFLYIHSIILSKKCSKYWYISFIPFVGFSYILYE